MTIERFHGQAEGRCRAVVHGGLVHAVATAGTGTTVTDQTWSTLTALKQNLIEAGSGKDRIVQATVYLTDMATKAEMDSVWCDWIGPPENWPQRACVGAALAPGDLIEIVVVAAVG